MKKTLNIIIQPNRKLQIIKLEADNTVVTDSTEVVSKVND